MSNNVQGNSLIILVFLSPTPSSRACCGRRYVSVIQVQEVSLNISATKQDIFIKPEQNLGQLYLYNPVK